MESASVSRMRTCLGILFLVALSGAHVRVHAQDGFDELQPPPPPADPGTAAPDPTQPPAQPQAAIPAPMPMPMPMPMRGPMQYVPPPMPAGPVGSVVRVRDDRALIEVIPGAPVFVGQRLEITGEDPNVSLNGGSEDRVVGEVELIRPDGVVVRIGPNQQVSVGDSAIITGRSRTSTTVAPAMPNHLVRLELMVGTFLRESGVIGEAMVSVHRGSGYYFVSMPSSVFVPERSIDGIRYAPNSGFQLMAGGGLQQRYVMLGVSAGATAARRDIPWDGAPTHARVVPALGAHLRVGALDGLSFTADLTLAVGRYFDEALYRSDFGIYAPFSSRVLVGLRGGLWLTGQSYSDLHILGRVRVRGNGGDGTWFVKAAMTFLWIREVPTTTTSGGGYYSDPYGATLGFQVGVERRFGMRGPTVTPTL